MKNAIIGTITNLLPKMTFKPVIYEFDYEGEFTSLDTVPILNAHLNLVNLLIEVKNKVAPGVKMNIGLKGFKEGSLEVQHIIELAVPTGMFFINNYDTIKNIVEIYSDLIKLKAFIKDEKPTIVVENSPKIELSINIPINGNGNTVNISQDAFKLYQENAIVNKLLNSTSKYIRELPQINSLDFRSNDVNMPSLSLSRDELMNLGTKNPFIEEEEENFHIYEKAVLLVRKPDLLPEENKKSLWKINHLGREISATLIDEDFIEAIKNGATFSSGTRLIADLKAYRHYDKSVGQFLEGKKFEIEKVYEVIQGNDNIQMLNL